ncbi:hypothetical protein SAMN02990966_07578 [Rhodospirillales bacterium URHD0017]|nr:hypothetical protein SAMN02990966_07578 [Rhodospirillales bacterium URHD0017]
MGWLYKKSLDGFKGPRQYLDAQFTHEKASVRSTVLRSKIIDNRVYYAAVERLCRDTGIREVWALICLIRYDPRDREGYVFGYKDMHESMEPYEYDCPETILKLLTPTNLPGAAAWRARCQERSVVRRNRSTRRSV